MNKQMLYPSRSKSKHSYHIVLKNMNASFENTIASLQKGPDIAKKMTFC